MKRPLVLTLALAGALACAPDTATMPPPPEAAAPVVSATGARWVSGYYVGYQRALYPETTLDFSLMTHVIVGAIEATSTGGVTTDFFIDNVNGPIMAKNISARAHSFHRKAILMLGGAGFDANLRRASASTRVAGFVANLLRTMDALGYDGIDVDWEPLLTGDKPLMLALIKRLRGARPAMILTVPVGWINPNWMVADPHWKAIAPYVNQINAMTYQMADNWGGWASWHQGALYGAAGSHPSSVSGTMQAYKTAGVPAAKLGIGIASYGSCWDVVKTMLAPLDGTSANVVASDNTMSYRNIMNGYYSAANYRWDAVAHAGYLTFGVPTGAAKCTLLSYENVRSITDKGAYVKSAGLGGAIVWTVGQGHLPSATVKDPLLKAAFNSIIP